MKTQEIRLVIEAPTDEVFEYVVEPMNTPKWIDDVSKETINTKQIGLGTLYSNEHRTLEVTDYERDVFFEMTNKKTGYQCSYSFRKMDETKTELIYFEAMNKGSALPGPMNEKSFKKLQELLEK